MLKKGKYHGVADITELYYEIHEVYYDEEDDYRIEGWTQNPTTPMGETVEELRKELEMYLKATETPVLEEVTLEDGTETLREIEE